MNVTFSFNTAICNFFPQNILQINMYKTTRNYDYLSKKQYAKILKTYSDPKFKAAFSLDKYK